MSGMAGAAMRESIPSYRQQHIEGNERALRAGFDSADSLAAPAWHADATVARS